jgi:hypothetical protein
MSITPPAPRLRSIGRFVMIQHSVRREGRLTDHRHSRQRRFVTDFGTWFGA